MSDYVRGSNPIWFEVDLSANAFDDSFYLFVLENTIPYVPATVYHDPDGNVPWTNPIQFLANGTLPPDIFFDPDVTYRLEFRQGNTSSDPLIYLVENYVPGSGGSSPITNVALATDNQITNPQFSLISFESSYIETGLASPDPIEVAPGWELVLAGTGNVTLERTALNNALSQSSNAPYALRITLSGTWTGTPYLRQRFNQNGMLWSGKYVSNALTARVEGASIDISAQLIDSNGNPLVEVLPATALSDDFEEYTGVGLVPATTNPDTPPNAYIEYRLFLPTTCDVFLTSFQLIASELPVLYDFEQDTIERQQDHTFHYYRDSILFQPKESLLSGWNFSHNPWQFSNTVSANVATNEYRADQTIVIQQAYVDSATGNNIEIGQADFSLNYGYTVQAVTSTNQFALVQYIDPVTVRPYWGSKLSSLIKLNARKQNSASNIRVKARLLYRASLPPTVAQVEPVASWAASGEPVYAAGWTAVKPKNDPSYNLSNGENTLTFDQFDLSAVSATNANMTMALVVYTIDPMIESGTPDNITFRQISLVPNDFAIDCNVLTYDQELQKLQYYYESSYNRGVLPGASSFQNTRATNQDVFHGVSSTTLAVSPFYINYNTVKRTNLNNVNLYNPNGTVNTIFSELYYNGIPATSANSPQNYWVVGNEGSKNILYIPSGNSASLVTFGSFGLPASGLVAFHYTVDARLGV